MFAASLAVFVLTSVLLVERITQTVEITKHTVDIEEKGVKLKLTIVDTPGFGDAVNNTEWYIKGFRVSNSTYSLYIQSVL